MSAGPGADSAARVENGDREAAVVEYLARENGFKSPAHCRTYLNSMFKDLELAGRTVMDVGCGKGWLCLYAAGRGAGHVVGLEPAAAGSTSGDLAELQRAQEALGLSRIEASADTIQSYEPGETRFDVIVMRSAINHLEEEACIHLKSDPAAREKYIEVFRKLNRLMNTGGTLVASDASRYNAFGMLGMRSPFARSIEWHKHQAPGLWASLLSRCGFGDARIEWLPPGPFRGMGALAANAAVTFFLNSRFRLTMTKISNA